MELLSENGEIGFICSDTFLTINTMKGLRYFLAQNELKIYRISYFSDETNYGMVYFNVANNNNSSVFIDDERLPLYKIERTPNYSFSVPDDLLKYFNGVFLKQYVTCSSGMTIGKNELFLKEVVNGVIKETYEYNIIEELKTEEKERSRNKFGKLTDDKKKLIESNTLEKVLRIEKKEKSLDIKLPHSDYAPYNKSINDIIYAEPKTYVYWKDDGEAVILFKKTGKWYLHGVGGKPFFKKEGFTWNLISDSIKVRYLPEGYILDSGCPVGVLNSDIEHDELYFIIGWLLTSIATTLLKDVINHTKNIQSKDIERMPYPSWVTGDDKIVIINYIKNLIKNKKKNNDIPKDYQSTLDSLFVID
jgi:hypothetical protein